MASTFPSSKCSVLLAASIVVVGLVLAGTVWWLTEARPPISMRLTAEVSDLDVVVRQQRDRKLLAAELPVSELHWSGVRNSRSKGSSGDFVVTAPAEPFAPEILLRGEGRLHAAANREGWLSLIVEPAAEARLRMDVPPDDDRCFASRGLDLPPEWQGIAAGGPCGRPRDIAALLRLESAGEARLDVVVEATHPEQGEPSTRRILSLPWRIQQVALDEPGQEDGEPWRSFVRSGQIRLDHSEEPVAELARGTSVAIVPASDLVLTSLALGSHRRGLVVEIAGTVRSILVGPDRSSRREIVPTRQQRWWAEEHLKWRIGGLGILVGAVGTLLIAVVGWFHAARQIDAESALERQLAIMARRLDSLESRSSLLDKQSRDRRDAGARPPGGAPTSGEPSIAAAVSPPADGTETS